MSKRTNWRGASDVFNFEDIDDAEKRGAYLQRRMIRRAQAPLLRTMDVISSWLAKVGQPLTANDVIQMRKQLDASTRATRPQKRKGR